MGWWVKGSVNHVKSQGSKCQYMARQQRLCRGPRPATQLQFPAARPGAHFKSLPPRHACPVSLCRCQHDAGRLALGALQLPDVDGGVVHQALPDLLGLQNKQVEARAA